MEGEAKRHGGAKTRDRRRKVDGRQQQRRTRLYKSSRSLFRHACVQSFLDEYQDAPIRYSMLNEPDQLATADHASGFQELSSCRNRHTSSHPKNHVYTALSS
jgi:hypothetical protein